MGVKITVSKCLTLCLGATFILTCFIASLPLQTGNALDNDIPVSPKKGQAKHKLAILVPFRDRFEELLEFVPHMYRFLTKQGISFDIFILQQRDKFRFNRASLINVGFIYTRQNYDYIAMHDVDLLPLNDKLSYAYPYQGPFHVSSPELHPKYHYPTFIGGILLLRREDYELVNGMSNRYWGWGLEDDEFYVRIKEANLNVLRPSNIKTGINDTFRHVHDRAHRRRDTRKCYNQREVTRKRDRQTGLHDVDFTLLNRNELTIDGLAVTVVNIRLNCNRDLTPWCLCPDPPKPESNKSAGTNKKA